jgi:hypothetical protein
MSEGLPPNSGRRGRKAGFNCLNRAEWNTPNLCSKAHVHEPPSGPRSTPLQSPLRRGGEGREVTCQSPTPKDDRRVPPANA